MLRTIVQRVIGHHRVAFLTATGALGPMPAPYHQRLQGAARPIFEPSCKC